MAENRERGESRPTGLPSPARPRVVVAAFIALFVVVLVLNFFIFRHFLIDITAAAAVAAMLGPLFDRLDRSLGGRRSLVAGILVASTALILIVPLSTYAVLLGQQAVDLFSWLRPQLEPEAFYALWEEIPARYPWLESLKEWLLPAEAQRAPLEVLSPALSQFASAANRLIQGAVTGLTSALFDLLVFLITLFFILRDGEKLGAELRGIAPVSSGRANEIYDRFRRTVKGVLYAMVVVPVMQGILAMIGFGLFGLPSPIFWGTILIIAATIPGVGSPLVWVPAGVYLLLAASWWQGIGLLAFGTLVISTSDNIVKPLLIRGTAGIHPLLAFFAILGGILSFGAVGFLVGPALLSVLLSLIHIYRVDILQAASLTDPDLVENSTAAPAVETETSS